MRLIVTIDTEEDNWANYSTSDNQVSNIDKLIPLQQMFDRYGVKPTYHITYPVATNPRSVAILKEILDSGKCEIGMHCHPWNTPPFEEKINTVNSMLCNLSTSLVLRKLTVLHETIQNNFGITPISFRAGRWGFNSTVAQAIFQLGYLVDTSVTPFVDWREYHGPDFSDFQLFPYRFDPSDIKTPRNQGALLEIPATVGFLQNNFQRCQRWSRYSETDYGKRLKMKGILYRLKMMNKVWLSPELAGAHEMIQLAWRLREKNCPCLNMTFHSTTLKAGLSPFVQNKDHEDKIYERIEKFLIFAKKEKIQPATISIYSSSSVTFAPVLNDIL